MELIQDGKPKWNTSMHTLPVSQSTWCNLSAMRDQSQDICRRPAKNRHNYKTVILALETWYIIYPGEFCGVLTIDHIKKLERQKNFKWRYKSLGWSVGGWSINALHDEQKWRPVGRLSQQSLERLWNMKRCERERPGMDYTGLRKTGQAGEDECDIDALWSSGSEDN